MATITDRNSPSFIFLPCNNQRTAWRPFGYPVLLVAPRRRDPLGFALSNSQVWNVRVYVEDVPRESRVAGPDHVGLRFPDRELYAVSLSETDLLSRLLPKEALTYLRDGQEITLAEAREGDYIKLTARSGVIDTIPYYQDADYYDLSDIKVEVEQLPDDHYNLVYSCNYYARSSSAYGGELLCINPDLVALALLRIPFNHPGEVISEFHRHTPAPYLTNTTLAQDTTLALYRPYTDLLQDIFDEQEFLKSINWVSRIPYEYIPYLSALLGWDLPFYPQSLDRLRLSVLKNTARLQAIKGSRAAVVELFRILGIDILISNLWWSADGKHLIRPGLTPGAGGITILPVLQIEPLLAGYETAGFGQLEIPLLHRPQVVDGLDLFSALKDGGDVIVDAYLVEVGSAAEQVLLDICEGGSQFPVGILEDPDSFTTSYGSSLIRGSDGRLLNTIGQALVGLQVGGWSQIVLSGRMGQVSAEILGYTWGRPPLSAQTLLLDRDENTIKMAFNGYIRFDGSDELPSRRRRCRLYSFATYTKQVFDVPPSLLNLQSNRFDIQLLVADSNPALAGQKVYASPALFAFAFDFLKRIKAFHSLLEVVRLTIDLTETYEVTGICLGGDIAQRPDTEMGRLQVPPAKIPKLPGSVGSGPGSGCSQFDPNELGYSNADIELRLRKLANLPEEHAAWKALDGRDQPETYTVTGSRLPARPPAEGRDSCKFTDDGQDRVIGPRVETIGVEDNPGPNATQDSRGGQLCPVDNAERGLFQRGAVLSSNSDSSAYGSMMVEGVGAMQEWCDLDGVTDYCYKGRVDDELLYRPTLLETLRYRHHAGHLSMGRGVYWANPTPPVEILAGSNHRHQRSRTGPHLFSAGTTGPNQVGYLLNEGQAQFLVANPGAPQTPEARSLLGRLYRGYGRPAGETLHFADRDRPRSNEQWRQLALRRPSLEIARPTLHFPGCRFPTMHALQEDFTHPEWTARPWDDPYSTYCGPKNWCGETPNWLNARLVPGPEGEVLVFDDRPYKILGNGLVPDIPGFGDHSIPTGWPIQPDQVVHALYSQYADGHPAITLDQTVQAGTGQGVVEVSTPLFGSARTCGSTLLDFVDGYPAVTGFQPPVPPDEDRYGFTFDPPMAQPLFFFGDGVFTGERGVRFDGGCAVVPCGDSSDNSRLLPCALEHFREPDGSWDFNGDHIEIITSMLLEESAGIGSILLDGSIPSLFELLSSPTPATGLVLSNLPQSGQFVFQDEYGQIYTNDWVWNEGHTVVDATVIVEQPYVWGQPPRSEFRGRDLYKWGIVSITRLVIQPTEEGYILVAKGESQYEDWIRTSRHCSDTPVDPFRYHFDQQVLDELELETTIGPSWVLPGSTEGAVWGDSDSPGVDDLQWMDVWS